MENPRDSSLKRYPNGTPLSTIERDLLPEDSCSASTVFSVASFNLLAPLYVRPVDKRTGRIQSFAAFEWVDDDDILDWNHRQHNLLQRLRDCRASVICLQELQLEKVKVHNTNSKEKGEGYDAWPMPSWIQPLLTADGYEAILPSAEELNKIGLRNLRVLGVEAAVTCAILVQSHVWNVLGTRRESNNVVSVCLQQNVKNSLFEALPIVINCVHLDAKDEEKRLAQFKKALDFSRFLLRKNHCTQSDHLSPEENNIYPLTAIFAGDMNAEFRAASGMHALLHSYKPDRYTEEDHLKSRATAFQFRDPVQMPSLSDWKKLQHETFQMIDEDYMTCLDRVPIGPTRCALSSTDTYKEDGSLSETIESSDCRNSTMTTWKLDHIVYTTDNLNPLAQWATLESDPDSCEIGLPNARHPTSDHLPVAAVFRINPLPNDLQDANKRKLIQKRVETLHQEKVRASNLLDMELDAKRKQIEQGLVSINVEGQNTKVTKKKLAKSRPPPELVDWVREKRHRLRQLRNDNQRARQAFADSLEDRYEKLILQDACGQQHWKKWVEDGFPETM